MNGWTTTSYKFANNNGTKDADDKENDKKVHENIATKT